MTTAGPVRVLFVDHETRLSGGQQDLLDLIRALDHGRVEAHVALPGEGPLEEALRSAGAEVHVVPMDPALRRLSRWDLMRRPHTALRHLGATVTASWRLGRLAQRLRPHVIHTNSMKAHLLMGVPARLLGVPLIWHVRDILAPGWLRGAFAALAWRMPARIVCISHAVRRQFEEVPAEARTRVVYNGIDRSRFEGRDAAAWRERLGASGDQPLVGIVGQIAWWKGQDVFIEAAPRVLEAVPDARFAVVGACLFPENEGAYEEHLHLRVRELGIEDRVVFSGWTDEPEAVMAALDVLVHASRLPEPFGRVIAEGMAAGIPVVASDEGAAPEIVGRTEGRVIPAGDPKRLADALIELLTDDVARARLGRAARSGAERFDISRTAQGVESVYREVLR